MSQWCEPGSTMCCICFKCVPNDQLAVDDQGQRWDVCPGVCAAQAGLGTPADAER